MLKIYFFYSKNEPQIEALAKHTKDTLCRSIFLLPYPLVGFSSLSEELELCTSETQGTVPSDGARSKAGNKD